MPSHEAVCLLNTGRLVEAGWVDACAHCVHPNATPQQVYEMRMAYFAGAHHLFTHMLAAARGKADDESVKLSLIDRELNEFIVDYQLYYEPAVGSA